MTAVPDKIWQTKAPSGSVPSYIKRRLTYIKLSHQTHLVFDTGAPDSHLVIAI